MSCGLTPICFDCARFRNLAAGVGLACEAFPEGIPTDVLASVVDHREPIEGDHGLRFVPRRAPDDAGRHMSNDALATDPPVSEAQRRAMWAAATGHSTLGIPQGVGKEFAEADPGGRLPARAKDMKSGEWKLMRWLLGKFFAEEEQESEHAEDSLRRAAGVAFVTPDGRALFMRRSASSDHSGEWSWPGGNLEGGEKIEDCARREAFEEVGDCGFDGMRLMDRRLSRDGLEFSTYAVPVDESFRPRLSDEHDDYRWAPLDEPPEPLHPGAKATLGDLAERAKDVADPTGKLSETTREDIGREGSERREEMPEGAFLGPDRTYPVKEKRDGEWVYTRNLLLAAARRARMQGRADIARRADAIREREFGKGGEDATQLHNTEGMTDYVDRQAGTTGGKGLEMSRTVKEEQPGYGHGGEGHPRARVWATGRDRRAADALAMDAVPASCRETFELPR